MRETDPDAKVRNDIEQYGWHCLNVWPQKGDARPGFSYTIGLSHSYGHPEIMIFGLGDRAHGILTGCANLIKEGVRFFPNQPNSEVLSGNYEVIFKPMRNECFAEYLGTALRFYGRRPFEALVMFWPDKEHRFPWESSEPNLQAEALQIV